MGASDLDANPTCNVVIAYEDFDAGKHARKTYDFLVATLGRECQFTNQMWQFDALGIPKLRERVAKDALQADIIIISSHGGDELAEPVKAWIESCLAEKGNANALVALFDCPDEDSLKTQRIRTYLADVAERGGMEFFAQPDDWPGPGNGDGPLPFRRDSDVDGRTLSTLGVALEQDRNRSFWDKL